MSSSALWAIAVITIAIFAGVIAVVLIGAKDQVPALIGIGTTIAAAVAALAASRTNRNDKDASR